MKNKNIIARIFKTAAVLVLSGLMVLSSAQGALAYERDMEYAYGDRFSEGLVVFKGKDGRLGYMNAKGKAVIPAKYDQAWDFGGGMTVVGVVNDKFYGYINKKGKQKINLGKKGYNYSSVNYIVGVVLVTKDVGQKISVMDKKGKILGTTKAKYDDFYNGNNYLIVVKDDKWGLIDKKGKVIVKPKYDEMDGEDRFTGNICFKKGDKWGLLNQKGKVLIKAKYDESFLSNEGLIPVSKDHKWGFIDAKSFKTVLEFEYDAATHFIAGKAIVKMDDKWQMIDKSGEVLSEIDGEYEEINAYRVGIFSVKNSDNKWGIMDKNGKVIVKPKYMEELKFDKDTGLARAIRKDGKCGFINTKGETVLKFK